MRLLSPLYIVLLAGERCEVFADESGYALYRPEGVLLSCPLCHADWLSNADCKLAPGESVTVNGRYPFGIEAITCDLCGRDVHGEIV